MSALVTINIAVRNGEKYIRQCLTSIFKQSYSPELIELNILDNASEDRTNILIKEIIKNQKQPKSFLLESQENLGMWPGQEELLKFSHGKYIAALSIDVILHPDFLKNVVRVIELDSQIGAVQAKIYKYQYPETNSRELANVIDTLGFRIFRSRRLINVGHGEKDHGQYDQKREIFAVEGAIAVFRREALEDCRLSTQDGKIIDRDFFWYGDDLDLTWRMRLFGWKQVLAPKATAYHDRQTTKTLAGGWQNFIKIRQTIPIYKRRLDWRNTTLAVIKNDFLINIIRDFPMIFWRQLRLWIYFLIFEPGMVIEIFSIAKLLPRMLKRRHQILSRSKLSAAEIKKWFH